MRLAYWSPDGSSSSTTPFTRAVIEQLALRAELVHVVAGDDRAVDGLPGRAGAATSGAGGVLGHSTEPAAFFQRGPDDVAVYELDDDERYDRVYVEALRNPGIVVLRDAALSRLCAFVAGGEASDIYTEEIRYATRPVLSGDDTEATPSEDPGEAALLSRRIVEANIATIVFDARSEGRLSALAPNAQLHFVGLDPSRGSEVAEVVAAKVVELAGSALEKARTKGPYLPLHPLTTPVAADAIGSWSATTGLAEAARRSVGCLLDAHVGVALEDVDLGAPTQRDRFPARFLQLQQGRPNPIEIFYLNINEFEVLGDEYLRRPDRRNYIIGSWYWELPELPSNLVPQTRRVDEIWVASRFVRETMQSYTPVPVHVFPSSIAPKADLDLSRKDFGIEPDDCVFIFNFDAQSTFARKNPWAVIDAYRQAFPTPSDRRGTCLVMKTINLDRAPEGRIELRHAVQSVGGLLIEDNLAPGEMAALISLSDVYVSLHRSEGFGLGMAEAMYFAKPVVATTYSGNADFVRVDTACPVGFRLTEVTEGDLRFNPLYERVYAPGQLWAEPNVAEAATWMRFLFTHPIARRRIGEAGAHFVHEQFSSERIGAAMRDRLRAIDATLAH